MLDLMPFTKMRNGPVLRCDIIDAMGEGVRMIDPKRYFRYGFRTLDNKKLKQGEMPEVGDLLPKIPKRYRDVFEWLRFKGDALAVPVGFDHLAMFAMMFGFDSGAVVFQTADVRLYYSVATVSWTKPALPKRWANIRN